MTQPQQNPWDVVGVSDGKTYWQEITDWGFMISNPIGLIASQCVMFPAILHLRNGQIIRVRPKT